MQDQIVSGTSEVVGYELVNDAVVDQLDLLPVCQIRKLPGNERKTGIVHHHQIGPRGGGEAER